MIAEICSTLSDAELCGVVRGAIEDKFGYDQIVEGEVEVSPALKSML